MFELTNWTCATPSTPGWLFASLERTPGLLRHWDGETWSKPVAEDAPESEMAAAVGQREPWVTERGHMWWCRPTPETLDWLAAEGAPWPSATYRAAC